MSNRTDVSQLVNDRMFVGCRNLPHVMSARLDQPWTLLEAADEVLRRSNCVAVVCKSCRPCLDIRDVIPETPTPDYPSFTQVHVAYVGTFETCDALLVRIFFGVCETCDAVYWTYEGPPFRRARSLMLV